MTVRDRIAALSPDKRAILEQRIGGLPRGRAPDPIDRAPAAGESVPVSFAQERLWILEQMEPGHSFYNLPLVIPLSGVVSVATLERALTEVVRRHESLRTTFASIDGRPFQIVAPAAPVPLEIVELQPLSPDEREAEAAAFVTHAAHQPFDLATGPLFRAALVCLTPVDYRLLLTMHHIVSDGWSLGVLYREISTLYSAFAVGRPSPLPDLPIQYGDFARWQRSHLQGPVMDRLDAYWKRALDGIPPLLALPTDRPRPPVQVFRGAAYATTIPKAVVEALRDVARASGATLFMALLTAFAILLSRYTNQTDVVIGSPVANRRRADVEGLIGFFVNTLVLRAQLAGDPTFTAALGRVRDVALDAFGHEDLPFERLVEELHPRRDLSHNPLFQVAFALQNTDGELLATAPGTGLHVGGGTSKFDLTLSARETRGGLSAAFEYNTELFEPSTISTLADHYHLVLRRAVSRPAARLSELLLLETDERRRAIAACIRNAPDVLPPTIVARLDQHSRVRPNAPALVFGAEELGWGELNRRANRLARRLRGVGADAETVVAICLERSMQLPLAMFGVWKAGAAFVPLDPANPTDRLAYMIGNSRARVLITQRGLADRVGDYRGELLYIDDDGSSSPSDTDPVELPAPADPRSLAYVIYTSGSTGWPKGVMVEHDGLRRVAAAQTAFGLEPGARILQFASASFDASVFELLLALGAGGTLCLAPADDLMPGPALLNTLRAQRINVIVIPPSSLAMLPAAPLPDLSVVIAAGESLPTELVARWASGRRMFNAYGPTEATIWATLAGCVDAHVPPTIGRPIAGAQVYIVDPQIEPVPVGMPGEIAIGGVGVARGYFGARDLTAERYVPDPFGDAPGARLYRTGDRARVLTNGEIQFLGRMDGQLKVRGYRIEPGEIESALLAHPALQDAAVVAQRTPGGDTRLHAYCVSGGELRVDADALRAFSRQKLPDYMIPSRFTVVDALPLTASGKVDRRALSARVIDDGATEDGAAPRTACEQAIAGIWREVLEVGHVGIYDGFFDVGGHSLTATRVMSRINERFNLSLPLRTIFERPTIVELAAALEQAAAFVG